ncbi:type 1 fimbrial protein [Paraburkholderia sp. Ac-20342]|nr:type 1 fimbrial protein [Paraburkholderia sp. Ac-20342]
MALAVLSAMGMTAAHAAPVVGATGLIKFTGRINANACTVASNSANVSSNGGSITVDMGSVAINDLGTEAQPASGTVSGQLTQPLTLELTCSAGTEVALKLTRQVAAGKGIGLQPGGAQNVQVMLINDNTGTPLDFTSGSVALAGDLVGGYTSFPLKAYYAMAAGKAATDVVTGVANATVNYELTYE